MGKDELSSPLLHPKRVHLCAVQQWSIHNIKGNAMMFVSHQWMKPVACPVATSQSCACESHLQPHHHVCCVELPGFHWVDVKGHGEQAGQGTPG